MCDLAFCAYIAQAPISTSLKFVRTSEFSIVGQFIRKILALQENIHKKLVDMTVFFLQNGEYS